VTYEDIGSVAAAGAVNVLYGPDPLLLFGATDDQFWSQDSTDVQDTAEPSDHFATSVG
jgi:hypothetical protein